MIPEQIGRYTIKQELGRGGMATVYLGHDPRFKRDVAVKVLPRQFLHDPEFRARFEREAQTIASLEHAAIVPVYDFGEDDGQPYLVMRFMPGGSLAQRLHRKPLDMAEVTRLFERLAPALDEAHARGIIHRDLKPANILFDRQGDPYISDFGLARLSEAGSTLTSNVIVGTPTYMSPEQARGGLRLDGRSDIYSLGVILFELLTGFPPYDAETPMGIAVKHITEPVPRLLKANPALPPGCENVIARVMAKERDKRFATAGELVTSLAQAGRGEALAPVSISDDTTMRLPASDRAVPDTQTRERRRWFAVGAWILGGLIGLSLLGAAVSNMRAAGLPDAPRTFTPTPTASLAVSAALVGTAPTDLPPATNHVPAATQALPTDPTLMSPASTGATVPTATRRPATATRTSNPKTPGSPTTRPQSTSNPQPGATQTPGGLPAATFFPSATVARSATPTRTVPPGPTNTLPPGVTPSPTRTPQPTATSPSSPTATRTPTSTHTHTVMPSATQTPVPPTATPTQTPSPTIIPDTQGPSISSLSANPTTVGSLNGCAVTFSADVQDPSGVASATVNWTAYNALGGQSGSGSASMVGPASGGSWSTTFNVTIPLSGHLTWSVTASDLVGNGANQGGGPQVNAVAPCA